MTIRCSVIAALSLGVLGVPGPAAADEEVTDIQQLSLADLLDTQVDIASKKPQTTRETPGIVTVITRNDLQPYSGGHLLPGAGREVVVRLAYEHRL